MLRCRSPILPKDDQSRDPVYSDCDYEDVWSSNKDLVVQPLEKALVEGRDLFVGPIISSCVRILVDCARAGAMT